MAFAVQKDCDIHTGKKPGDTIHNRRSIRLHNWDYSRPGAYFVTMCVQERECLLGKTVNSEMRLNEYGRIAEMFWREIPNSCPRVRLDEFVIMPNHIHGIIIIRDSVGARSSRPIPIVSLSNAGRDDPAPTIGKIIARFKYQSTKQINLLRDTGMQKIWQRNYYEHVIRDEKSLYQIRHYIRNNPAHWDIDEENPKSLSVKKILGPRTSEKAGSQEREADVSVEIRRCSATKLSGFAANKCSCSSHGMVRSQKAYLWTSSKNKSPRYVAMPDAQGKGTARRAPTYWSRY